MIDSKFLRKFGLTTGLRIGIIGKPMDHAPIFQDIARHGIEWTDEIEGELDQIWFWPLRLEGLPEQLGKLASQIPSNGGIWVFMPKKKFAARRAIAFSWEMLQQCALRTDLVDNKVASLSDTDYGTRFVIRKDLRYKYED